MGLFESKTFGYFNYTLVIFGLSDNEEKRKSLQRINVIMQVSTILILLFVFIQMMKYPFIKSSIDMISLSIITKTLITQLVYLMTLGRKRKIHAILHKIVAEISANSKQ